MMMNFKSNEGGVQGPNVSYCHCICLQGLRKIMKNLTDCSRCQSVSRRRYETIAPPPNIRSLQLTMLTSAHTRPPFRETFPSTSVPYFKTVGR
jgi:hypothetical protein